MARSVSVHERDPNATGFNRRSYFPVSTNFLVAQMDFALSACCIKIQPMPSALQSVFKKVGLRGSNRAQTGDDVIPVLSSLNKEMRSGVQAI
jgi:hypothetical protein